MGKGSPECRRPSDGRGLAVPLVLATLLLTGVAPAGAASPSGTPRDGDAFAAAPSHCSKIWRGQEAELEEMLRTAKVRKLEDIGQITTKGDDEADEMVE